MYKTFYDIEICVFVYKIFLSKNIPSFEQQTKKLSHLSLIRFYSRRLMVHAEHFGSSPRTFSSGIVVFWAQEVAIFFCE